MHKTRIQPMENEYHDRMLRLLNVERSQFNIDDSENMMELLGEWLKMGEIDCGRAACSRFCVAVS